MGKNKLENFPYSHQMFFWIPKIYAPIRFFLNTENAHSQAFVKTQD
jgi:hypothetical protein